MLVRLKSGNVYRLKVCSAEVAASKKAELAGKMVKNGKPFGPARWFKRSAIEAILNEDGTIFGWYVLDKDGAPRGVQVAGQDGLCVPHAPIEARP